MKTNKIKKLRIEGFSLKEISKKLTVPYSTVRRACKNVKMSKAGKERYHLNVKGIIKCVNIKKELTEEKVRIMSNLLFDGAVYETDYHYSIMYVNSSKGLVNQFIKDMSSVYEIKHSHYVKEENCFRVKYFSKQIYDDLLSYFVSFSTSDKKCSIPSVILKNREFKIIVLRSFWENEGSISKWGKLSADLKSLKVIKQLSQLHDEFGLKHNISIYWKNGPAYKLFLSKSKENYKKFIGLNLFLKAKVTKGYFKGKEKMDVLKEYYQSYIKK